MRLLVLKSFDAGKDARMTAGLETGATPIRPPLTRSFCFDDAEVAAAVHHAHQVE
jgi:hypothetical protein